jgi:hypothetical protein
MQAGRLVYCAHALENGAKHQREENHEQDAIASRCQSCRHVDRQFARLRAHGERHCGRRPKQ